MTEPLPLRANRDFSIFWFVQALSVLGTSFSMVAVPLLALQATGSVTQMGLVTGFAGAGALLTGIVAGVLVDRHDRRRLMLGCDVARLALFAAVPVLWAVVGPTMWLLYVVMTAAAAFGTVFDVAYSAAIPNLVHRSQVTGANSRLEAAYGLGFIVGPMLAGVIAGVFGPVTAIAVDAATFGVSAVGLLFVRLRMASPDGPRAPATVHRHLGRELLAGVRFLLGTPALRAITLLYVPVTFLSLGLIDVFIFYLRHDLGQNSAMVGVMFGVASVGGIVGALVTPRVKGLLGFGRTWLFAYLVCGIAVTAAGVTFHVAVAIAAATFFAFSETMAAISSASLRQTVTPDALLGRVTAAFRLVHYALGPLGALILTVTVEHVGVRAPLAAVGGIFVLIVLGGSFTVLRHREPVTGSATTTPAPVAVPGPTPTWETT